jgi:hypothetical protein
MSDINEDTIREILKTQRTINSLDMRLRDLKAKDAEEGFYEELMAALERGEARG